MCNTTHYPFHKSKGQGGRSLPGVMAPYAQVIEPEIRSSASAGLPDPQRYGCEFLHVRGEGCCVGIPVDRDRSFRFVVTGDSGSS
jgi:hypothetical protein